MKNSCENNLNPINETLDRSNTIVLFDVDGTLTPPRQKISQSLLDMLLELKKYVSIGFVGTSDLEKQKEQIGDNIFEIFDYGFSQNGIVSYFDGEKIYEDKFVRKVGDEEMNDMNNFILGHLAKIDLPRKRGTFIELREGNMNITPMGRNSNLDDRKWFIEYDKEHHIRQQCIDVYSKEFPNMEFVIGGEIGIDVYPSGWDKTFCLRFLKEKFQHIFFFGDKTKRGGNDFEIFHHPSVCGFTVKSPEDTMKKVTQIFLGKKM